jgi:hypothetical protein
VAQVVEEGVHARLAHIGMPGQVGPGAEGGAGVQPLLGAAGEVVDDRVQALLLGRQLGAVEGAVQVLAQQLHHDRIGVRGGGGRGR